MPINFYRHGGKHQVAIIWYPKVCPGRFLHLSKDEGETGGWVIRDFIGKKQYLSRENDGGVDIENETMLSLREEEVVSLGIRKVMTGSDAVLTVELEDQIRWTDVLKELSETMINKKDFETPAGGLPGSWKNF